MFPRGNLVPFTRRSSDRQPAAPRDESVEDVLRRLEEAEREVARTMESLDAVAALLRGDTRPAAPAARPARTPQNPSLRRTVPRR